MGILSFISRLLRRRRRFTRRDQDSARAETAKRIEARGYQLIDVSGNYNGKIAARRYLLMDPDGNKIDNNGEGFACSADALRSIIDEPRLKKAGRRSKGH